MLLLVEFRVVLQADVPLPCPSGTFRSVPGAGSPGDCGRCPGGFMCSVGSSLPLPCPAGTSCPPGSSNYSVCGSGTYCPPTVKNVPVVYHALSLATDENVIGGVIVICRVPAHVCKCSHCVPNRPVPPSNAPRRITVTLGPWYRCCVRWGHTARQALPFHLSAGPFSVSDLVVMLLCPMNRVFTPSLRFQLCFDWRFVPKVSLIYWNLMCCNDIV